MTPKVNFYSANCSIQQQSWSMSIFCTRVSSYINKPGYREDGKYPSGYFTMFKIVLAEMCRLDCSVYTLTGRD